ncbi:MAG: extracellular solute-binding protein [Paenibacillaceae bacterium]
MSRRKNSIIFITIVFLCFLLLTQLMGDNAENTPNLQDLEQVTGLPVDPNIIPGSEPIELTAVVFMEPEEFRTISGWNDEFQKMHPGTTITLTNLTYEQSYLYFKEQARTGQSSNIMMLNNSWISEFAARGYLSYRANEFNPIENGPTYNQALAQTEWNGYTWAVPHSVDPYIVVWNPKLIKNIEGESELPESLDEWLVLHDHLLLNDPTYEGIHINAKDAQAFVSLIWALQGEWSTELDHMYTLDTDKDIELLERLMTVDQIDNKDGLTKPLLNMQPLPLDDSWEKFANNQFGAMVVPLSEWMARKNGSEAISISLLGGDSQETGLWLSGTSYAVSSQSLHQEMAYSWITWMTNLTHQIQTLGMTYTLPVNLTTLDSNNMLSLPQSELLRKTVEKGRAWSKDPQLTIKMNVLQQAIGDIAENPSLIQQWNVQLEQSWKQINATTNIP